MCPMRDGDVPARALMPEAGDSRGAGDARGLPDPRDIGGARRSGNPRGADAAQQPAHAPHMLSASRYLAWLYSSASEQPVFARLCEIESEIAGSLRRGIDHHVAHARLQWWREECERCAQGRPVHPLTRELVKAYGAVTAYGEAPPQAHGPALAATHGAASPEAHGPATAGTHGITTAGRPSPLAGISGFVDTAVWDLAGATFETRKELTAYCERWATAMFETSAAKVTARETRSAENAHSTRARQAADMMRAPGATDPVSAVTGPSERNDERSDIQRFDRRRAWRRQIALACAGCGGARN